MRVCKVKSVQSLNTKYQKTKSISPIPTLHFALCTKNLALQGTLHFALLPLAKLRECKVCTANLFDNKKQPMSLKDFIKDWKEFEKWEGGLS